MSDSDEDSQITRNNPLRTEASTNEEVVTLTSTSSTNVVVEIHKQIATTAEEGGHSSNIDRNSSVTPSTTPRSTFAGPASSNLSASSTILITEYDAESGGVTNPTENDASLPNQTPANVPNHVTQPQQNSRINSISVPYPRASHRTSTNPLGCALPSARNNNVPFIYQRISAPSRFNRYFRAFMGCSDESDSPILPSFDEATSADAVRISPLSITSCAHLGPPPLLGAPPSYLAVIRLGPPEPYTPNRTPLRIQPSPPFIAPIPPPTYAQAQGFYIDAPVIISVVPTFLAEQIAFGPNPLSVICSRCAHAVVTSTQSHRTTLTHLSALILCLCGCWPWCLLPYCIDSCKRTDHRCPRCHQMLGTFPPR